MKTMPPGCPSFGQGAWAITSKKTPALSLTPSEKGLTRFPNSGGLSCLLRTSARAHLLSFCLRAMHVLVIDQALPDSRNQGVLEISRFLCMLFLSVRGFSDYAVRGHRVAFLLLGMKPAS